MWEQDQTRIWRGSEIGPREDFGNVSPDSAAAGQRADLGCALVFAGLGIAAGVGGLILTGGARVILLGGGGLGLAVGLLAALGAWSRRRAIAAAGTRTLTCPLCDEDETILGQRDYHRCLNCDGPLFAVSDVEGAPLRRVACPVCGCAFGSPPHADGSCPRCAADLAIGEADVTVIARSTRCRTCDADSFEGLRFCTTCDLPRDLPLGTVEEVEAAYQDPVQCLRYWRGLCSDLPPPAFVGAAQAAVGLAILTLERATAAAGAALQDPGLLGTASELVHALDRGYAGLLRYLTNGPDELHFDGRPPDLEAVILARNHLLQHLDRLAIPPPSGPWIGEPITWKREEVQVNPPAPKWKTVWVVEYAAVAEHQLDVLEGRHPGG